MRTQRQVERSTKNLHPAEAQTSDEENPAEESTEPPILRKKEIFIAVYSPRDTMHTNQTGKLPHSSIRGSNYQMIIHEIDGASTWVEVMKNRTEGEMIEEQRRGLLIMKQQGITPVHQVLDKEISQTYKDDIRELGMSYQLVPPDDHHRNIAKRYIQTWRDHFVVFLSRAAATFPLYLWCQAIP